MQSLVTVSSRADRTRACGARCHIQAICNGPRAPVETVCSATSLNVRPANQFQLFRLNRLCR